METDGVVDWLATLISDTGKQLSEAKDCLKRNFNLIQISPMC